MGYDQLGDVNIFLWDLMITIETWRLHTNENWDIIPVTMDPHNAGHEMINIYIYTHQNDETIQLLDILQAIFLPEACAGQYLPGSGRCLGILKPMVPHCATWVLV